MRRQPLDMVQAVLVTALPSLTKSLVRCWAKCSIASCRIFLSPFKSLLLLLSSHRMFHRCAVMAPRGFDDDQTNPNDVGFSSRAVRMGKQGGHVLCVCALASYELPE